MPTERRAEQGRTPDPAARGDPRLLAATLLLGLGILPLLPELSARIGLFVGAVLALRLVSLRWPRWQPRVWALALLTLAGGLNVVATYGGVTGRDAGTALLLTMMALKLLEVRAARDLRVLLLLFGFLLGVQFLFNDSAPRAALLALLLVAQLALLFDLSPTGAPAPVPQRLRRAAGFAVVITVQAVPLALLLFLLFPRLQAPLWDLGIGKSTAVTGLRGWLEPGSVQELVVSGEEALRVRFDRPPPMPAEHMYWRGLVVWHTDGRRWTQARDGELPPAGTRIHPQGERLGYSVLLEPTDQRRLVGLDMPLEVPRDARLTGDFEVRTARPVENRRAYRMTSAVRYRTAGLSAAEQAAATALPANITPRMRALAERWRAGAADPRDVVRRALAHFNEAPFRYTLLPPDLGDNPMDAFLFDARSGFCEHYASSFALLMRIADIPTRIVLGYLGGDYNPLSGDYVVRQSDAHAWNEVWLDDLGWVRVDPTAAVDPARVDTSARLSALGADAPSRFRVDDRSWAGRLAYGVHLLADALDAGWREWVVGFSYDRQQRLLDALGMPQLRAPGLALVMIASAATVVALLTLALSREPLSREPVTRCYQRFLRRLERIGLGRRCDEGPVEHRDRILAGRPDLQPAVDAVVIPYLRLRFGLTALPGDRQRLKRGVAAFRPRRHPPRRDSGAREPT